MPTLADPWPAPGVVWPEVYGTVGATLACETGIEAAGLAVRIDATGDGDYLDGGAEDWTPVTGYSDAPEIQLRASVRFPRSGTYHWEVKGRDVVSGWWVYSGSEGRQGISDDWTVTINRLPRTWQLPQDVADLFAARDSLQDGDNLRLAPGTWAGGVDFGPWNVAIVGDGAPEEVIIQAPPGDINVLRFRSSPVPGNCWIQNLTLRGGTGDVVAATTLFARNCRFPEGGIWGSLLDARECVSTGHLFGSVGMTLYECEHSGGVDWSREIPTSREDVQPGVAWVARCVFRNNWIGGMGGEGAGLLLPTGCDGLVANNVFRDNSIDGWNENGSPPRAYGAGLYATGNVDAVGNLFVDNGVVVGGDLGFAGGAAARTSGAFIGNTVVDCWAQGLTWPDASLSIVSASEIRDNIFAGNIGNGNTCTASGCNLYWQNLDSYGTQPWATGNCGVDEGGEVWEDPLFVDAANGDYRLLPASPAWPLNHLDTAPGCGLLGAFGRSWPVAILDIELRYNPLTARLSLRCEQVGLPVHIYAATDADGSFSELTTFTPTDYETLVEIPLGTYMPATRFFRATQELPDMSLAGGWCWSLPAGSHPLPEPPLVTELDRLQRAGLPWKPQIR